MSKHLTASQIDQILNVIARMRGDITWDKLTARLESELGIGHSKFSLMRNPQIKAAYADHKAELRERKLRKDKAQKSIKSQLPPDPVAHIADLEKRLQQQSELVATVLENAARLGVPIETMKRPANVVRYSPTKAMDR